MYFMQPDAHRSAVDQARPGVLAVIPARGGSKGLPGKNTLPLGGRPLIAWTIEPLLASALVDRVVVSTDDPRIAEVAQGLGAEVPFLRPPELSGDASTVGGAIDYTLRRLEREEGYSPEIYVVTYPTHPFKSVDLVDFMVGKALEGYSPVHTVRALDCASHRCLREEGGRLRPVRPMGGRAAAGDRRYLRRYGLMHVVRRNAPFRPYNRVIDDKACLMDIDAPEDLCAAELLCHHATFTQ